MGGRLEIVGHGLRDRQVRGRLAADQPATLDVIRARRFRCLACGAVITVVPLGVAARRHFGAGTIGLALARFGGGATASTIRAELGGVGPPEDRGWVTLRRWIGTLKRDALFPRLDAIPIGPARPRAARAAMILSTYAEPRLARAGFEEQVFAGAVRLARAA